MKHCNKCNMIVDEENICPYCRNNIERLESVQGKERIAFNKYYLIYLAKQLWCSILATVIYVWILMSFEKLPKGRNMFLSIVLLLLGYIYGIFERPILRFYKNYYSSAKIGGFNYKVTKAEIFGPISKYMLPVFAIIMLLLSVNILN